MPGVEGGERTANTWVNGVENAFEAGRFVERLAESVGGGELQAVRETLIKRRLQGVVGGVGDGVLGEDAAEDRNAVNRAANAGSGVAIRRRVTAEADQVNVSGSESIGRNYSRTVGAVRNMESVGASQGTLRNEKSAIGGVRATGSVAKGRIYVQTGLRISVVEVVGAQQAVALGSYIPDL